MPSTPLDWYLNKSDSSESVTNRMKVIMVVWLTLLSQVWGKYYLIKTEDKVFPEAGVDYSNDDDDKQSKAETKIYKDLTKTQLNAFKHNLTRDEQEELIELMNKVIDNPQHVKEGEGDDDNFDIIDKIRNLTSGLEGLLKGINGILGLVTDWPMPPQKTKYKKPRKIKKISRSKKYKNSKKYKGPSKSRGQFYLAGLSNRVG